MAGLLFDEELLFRGGVMIGILAKSYGQVFGAGARQRPQLESK
jgi:hypothetical protein